MITIPDSGDNFNKFLTYIGLILIGFSYLSYSEVNRNSESQYNNTINRISILELECQAGDVNYEIDENRLNSIKKKLKKDPDNSEVKEQGRILLKKLNNYSFNCKKNQSEIQSLYDQLSRNRTNRLFGSIFNLGLGFIGVIIVFYGATQWNRIYQHELNLKFTVHSSEYDWCESCGRMFSPIVQNGTSEDGSLNLAFCKDCYQNGEFTAYLSEETKIDYFERAIQLQSNKQNKKILEARFKNLERWKVNRF